MLYANASSNLVPSISDARKNLDALKESIATGSFITIRVARNLLFNIEDFNIFKVLLCLELCLNLLAMAIHIHRILAQVLLAQDTS